MQAVIRSGGKQYLVKPGQTIEIDLVAGDAKTLEFEPLLVIDEKAGVQVGAPTVAGITVTADVEGEVKGQKLQILKFKPKKRIKKQTGHRQHYTQITITGIGVGKAKPAAKAAKPAVSTKAATAKATA